MTLGAEAEALAATFLQQQGLKLVEKNYHCRFGEIDLIMRDGKQLVFVEVRLRSNANFGGAGASITSKKQQKLRLTADHYMMEHGNINCRFDAILMSSMQSPPEWIRNAF